MSRSSGAHSETFRQRLDEPGLYLYRASLKTSRNQSALDNDAQHALRQTHGIGRVTEQQGGQRGERAGPQDDRVPGEEGRDKLLLDLQAGAIANFRFSGDRVDQLQCGKR